jgi:molybdopterin/thiamine biosynthesis adenylyltransferase
MYLAAAGVGTLGLFDNDKVELNNLHRQIGHKNRSIGMVKTESLKETLLELNPYDKINIHPFVTVDSVDSLEEYSLILDGSDNPECRYLVNDYCVQNSKIVISGACIGWEGQMVAYGNGSACYRCLWGDDELSHGGCSTRGVLGMLPGIVSMVVAVETIKFITMGRTDLSGSMLLYDGLTQMFRKVRLRNKRQDCIACGTSPIEI